MHTYISYVIQTPDNHKHFSEVLNSDDVPYTYSNDPEVHDVMKWADKKQKELKKDETLVIVGVLKL